MNGVLVLHAASSIEHHQVVSQGFVNLEIHTNMRLVNNVAMSSARPHTIAQKRDIAVMHMFRSTISALNGAGATVRCIDNGTTWAIGDSRLFPVTWLP